MFNLRTTLVGAVLLAAPILSPAQPAAYTPVTDARLKNPEPGNWLHYRGNYQGWGYSPLAKINTGNVSKLQLAWSFATGQVEGHQSPPFVNNGYMFVTTPGTRRPPVAEDGQDREERLDTGQLAGDAGRGVHRLRSIPRSRVR